jgi:uncharacterized membrane protein
MAKRKKEQTIQWPKEEKNKQYNGQRKKRTNNTMAKRRKKQILSVLSFFWPLYCLFFSSFGHCIVCFFLLLAIVLFVLFFFWPLYCVKKFEDTKG